MGLLPRRVLILWIYALSSSLDVTNAFAPSSRIAEASTARTILRANNDNSWVQSREDILEQLLVRIDNLQEEVQGLTSQDDIEAAKERVDVLHEVANRVFSMLYPPTDLSMEEYKSAIRLFIALPPPFQLGLMRALGFEDSAATDALKVPEIVSKLYQDRAKLTPKLLADSMKEANAKRAKSSTSLESETQLKTVEALEKFLEDSDGQRNELTTMYNGLYPRVTRQDDRKVDAQDLEVLINAFDSSTFSVADRPIEIPGGYVIRGENKKSSGKELIETLDEKLPKDWDCAVFYSTDFTDTSVESFLNRDNALVLMKKEFPPMVGDLVYRMVSGAALSTIVLFSIGVYGANEAVLNQLTDATAISDFSGLDWFNGKVAEVLGPILIILASHEIGHLLVSKQRNFETASLVPTFLPIFGNLPLLGTLTRLKTSPQNFTALFDFAFLGPLLGLISSFIFLGTGLFATKAALDGDANAAQFLPALPISVLRLSTFGASIIDNFFAGGDGFITAQDVKTAVPLHPFAIAGYVGMLINAIEMLPVGATDGGRMSLAMFGREAQSVIGGLVWLLLLVASFQLQDQQASLLVAAWATNSIFQNDMEIPCRDETENPGLARSTAGFALFFLAALIIVPL